MTTPEDDGLQVPASDPAENVAEAAELGTGVPSTTEPHLPDRPDAAAAETEPVPAEPVHAESVPVEVDPAEPAPVEPPPVAPAPVEPAPVEPVPVEPVPVEPPPVEPPPVEPAPAEPAPVEPTPVEPVPVEPVPVEPVRVEPVPTGPVPVEPVLAEPVPVEPAPVEPGPVEPVSAPTPVPGRAAGIDEPQPQATAPVDVDVPEPVQAEPPHTPSGSVAAGSTAGAATAASALADLHAHAEHSPADTDGEPTSGRRFGLPVVLTALLALLLLAAVAFLGYQLRQQQLTETARDEATAASREAARLLFSYDHATLDEDFAKGLATTTGTFTEEYSRTTKEVVAPVAKEYKAVVVADVVESAVVRAAPDEVTALVFLNQATTSSRVTGQQVDQSRVRMTLVKRGNRWLVSQVKAL